MTTNQGTPRNREKEAIITKNLSTKRKKSNEDTGENGESSTNRRHSLIMIRGNQPLSSERSNLLNFEENTTRSPHHQQIVKQLQ